MSAAALDELFQLSRADREYQGCTGFDGQADCVYSPPGGGGSLIHLLMELTDGSWQVVDVREQRFDG